MDQARSTTGVFFISRPSVELCAKCLRLTQSKQLWTKDEHVWHYRFKSETYNFLQDRNYLYFTQFYFALQMKGGWESNINVLFLFGISITLKSNKKLTSRINCFHLWSIIFQICNCLLSFMWTGGRAGNCSQHLLGGSSLPFSPASPLLRLSWEFSHAIHENKDSKKTTPRSFMSGNIFFLNFRYSGYFIKPCLRLSTGQLMLYYIQTKPGTVCIWRLPSSWWAALDSW